MALSWNEIKDRAVKFSKEWEGTTDEDAEAKPFLVEFFNVFGISRKKIATFEHKVKKLDEHDGYIDLLWKGTILVEMKSRGKNLDKAYQQAKDYLHGLKQHELPKYILISDFETFRLYDQEEEKTVEFKINELVNNVQHFGYILGYQKKTFKEQDPANIKAAELMGKLHDRLKEIGYDGHPLEVYLVRLLFCLFAEDTTIFDKQQFQDYIDQRTTEDGSDLAAKLQELFQVLNTPNDKRFKNLDEQLNDFPYVNGKLFEEVLPTASFDTKMRQALLDCCYLDWSKISPAIFGSMFQSVMNPKERRNLGAHYTSEINILKLIKPLFLDDLWTEFESVKGNKNKLQDFHKKISVLKFLDPACGCGNFLVITYRELRLLEIEILRSLNKSGQGFLDVRDIIWLDVDMMCGIEYEEFPARIAEVAMWLIDHQMNMQISNEFGQYFVRLPLNKAAKIVHANALQIDWGTLKHKNTAYVYADELNYKVDEPVVAYGTLNVITKSATEIVANKDFPVSSKQERIHYDYIIGNPPFKGERYQSEEQRKDIEYVFGEKIKLDYVACWYYKAAQLIKDSKTKVGFVSTNSIVQGEQVPLLWVKLFNELFVHIHFAHQTFKWNNEAKGNANVFCVIIGFANYNISNKQLFEYENISEVPMLKEVKNINAYLLNSENIFIYKKSKPICNVPNMQTGSRANDKGLLLFTKQEKEDFELKEPQSIGLFKKVIGGTEFINSIDRFALWLEHVNPKIINESTLIGNRINEIKKFRNETPQLFSRINKPQTDYIFIPQLSSEKREYIPIGFVSKEILPLDPHFFIEHSTYYHLGILLSKMHMIWTFNFCGRLESRVRYSSNIIYNNFPWPNNISEKDIKDIEVKTKNIIDVRNQFQESSLADLYSPTAMPPTLIKAHKDLDKVVDSAYNIKTYISNEKRMEVLFKIYESYNSDLFSKVKNKKSKK